MGGTGVEMVGLNICRQNIILELVLYWSSVLIQQLYSDTWYSISRPWIQSYYPTHTLRSKTHLQHAFVTLQTNQRRVKHIELRSDHINKIKTVHTQCTEGPHETRTMAVRTKELYQNSCSTRTIHQQTLHATTEKSYYASVGGGVALIYYHFLPRESSLLMEDIIDNIRPEEITNSHKITKTTCVHLRSQNGSPKVAAFEDYTKCMLQLEE